MYILCPFIHLSPTHVFIGGDGCFHDKSFFKLGADEVICPYVCWRFDMAPSTVLHFAELCILDLSCLDLFSQVSPFYSYLFMYHVNGFLFLALFSYQSHPPAAASGRKLRPSSKPTAIPGGWGGVVTMTTADENGCEMPLEELDWAVLRIFI